MEEMWIQLESFPNYSISSEGRIRNDERDTLVLPSRTRQGGLKVGLVNNGVQHTRSLKVLVAQTFVDGQTEIFATPIQLDGDQENVRADNIVWRPRWFAWKYTRQFEKIDDYIGVGPLSERKSGLVYQDIVEASLSNGVLFDAVNLALVNKIPVFPTWQMFDWIRVET